MCVIEFGGQIIDEVNAIGSLALFQQPSLSQLERTNDEFLLAPRQYLRGILSLDDNPNIRALRA